MLEIKYVTKTVEGKFRMQLRSDLSEKRSSDAPQRKKVSNPESFEVNSAISSRPGPLERSDRSKVPLLPGRAILVSGLVRTSSLLV